jgi:hypothetical protein
MEQKYAALAYRRAIQGKTRVVQRAITAQGAGGQDEALGEHLGGDRDKNHLIGGHPDTDGSHAWRWDAITHLYAHCLLNRE